VHKQTKEWQLLFRSIENAGERFLAPGCEDGVWLRWDAISQGWKGDTLWHWVYGLWCITYAGVKERRLTRPSRSGLKIRGSLRSANCAFFEGPPWGLLISGRHLIRWFKGVIRCSLHVEGKRSAHVTLASALSGPVHDPQVSVMVVCSGINCHDAVDGDQFYFCDCLHSQICIYMCDLLGNHVESYMWNICIQLISTYRYINMYNIFIYT